MINGERKILNPPPENVGKLLIFCEGHTEYNYLNYFKNYIDNNMRAKYSDITIKPINTEGNAMHVYNYAEDFLASGENAQRYLHYEKHLVFDCDAPKDIQNVIQLMEDSDNQYILDYSNLLFETWLVMHFQDLEPGEQYDKRTIIRLIRDYLDVVRYTKKTKAAPGTIAKILGSNGSEKIRAAIQNAKRLEQYWKTEGKEIHNHIAEMNPAAGIYILVERLLDEVVFLCG